MSGIHARPHPHRVFDAIDSTLQRSGITRVLRGAAATPEPAEPPLAPGTPFDGRRRPMQPVAEPLGPRPTSSPDPERDAPVDEAAEAVYLGIQAHFDQYTAPFQGGAR